MIDPRTFLKGAARRLQRLLPRSPGPAILMYHRIGRAPFDPWGLCVEQERFALQLEWLARNRELIPLTDFAQRHRDGRLEKRAVALTFDDGYASVVGSALPLLRTLDLSATVFLPVEIIESDRDFWWDELAQIVMNFANECLRLDGEALPMPAPDALDGLWPPGAPPRTARQKLFHSLWARLRRKRPQDIQQSLAELRAQGGSGNGSDRPMTSAEIRSTASSVLTFGSHALLHPSLPALDYNEKAREIADSMARCASLTGSPPKTFAYPFGDVDEASMRLVEEAGFICACATGNRFVTARSDRFALPRVYVGDWDASRLAQELGHA